MPNNNKNKNNNNNNNNNNNGVCVQLHFNICKEIGVKLARNTSVFMYQNQQKEGKVTILWNQVKTDKTIPNNKPDIIICDNEKGIYVIIDVAISGDRNVMKKEAETILTYKNLTIEIHVKY